MVHLLSGSKVCPQTKVWSANCISARRRAQRSASAPDIGVAAKHPDSETPPPIGVLWTAGMVLIGFNRRQV